MEIRPATVADLDRLLDIDGTIESSHYLHVDRSGEGLSAVWRLEERPLRNKLIERNALDDETSFTLRQVVSGADEGMALVAAHEGVNVALLVAHDQPGFGTIRVVDLRIDYDHRRQGLGTAMLYQVIADARSRGLRAVAAQSRTDNLPGARFLSKCGFDLAGLDARRHSNHDLVKESVTLFWYAAFD